MCVNVFPFLIFKENVFLLSVNILKSRKYFPLSMHSILVLTVYDGVRESLNKFSVPSILVAGSRFENIQEGICFVCVAI